MQSSGLGSNRSLLDNSEILVEEVLAGFEYLLFDRCDDHSGSSLRFAGQHRQDLKPALINGTSRKARQMFPFGSPRRIGTYVGSHASPTRRVHGIFALVFQGE